MSSIASGQLFYRRLASPLHAARASVAALWALALMAAALVLFNPIVLAALAIAVLGAAWGAGVGRQLLGMLRLALLLALPIVAVNVLVSRQGITVFARLGDLGPFGQGDLTTEALVYGAVIAQKVTLLMLITTLASLAVDPDELLRVFRRLSFRSALTLALAMRMVPLLAADARRLADAQRTRPGAPAGAMRTRLALVSAIVAGSLDRASEVAATLELRGYALAGAPRLGRAPRPGRVPRLARVSRRARVSRLAGVPRIARASRGRPWSRHDLAFSLSALAVLALALAGRADGAASFDAYPLLRVASGAGTWALCAALAVAVLAPFLDRRGIE